MGMSASQARLLSLTTRLSDLEFTAQQISNQKVRLADSSQAMTDKYMDALKTKKLVMQTNVGNATPTYKDLSAKMLLNFDPDSIDSQRLLTNAKGKVLMSNDMLGKYATANGNVSTFLASLGVDSTDTAKTKYYTNLFNEASANGAMTATKDELADPAWLLEQFQSGGLILEKYNQEANEGEGGFDSVSWQSGDAAIQEVNDDTEIAIIKAEYESKMSSLQSTDKKFELDLKEIETQHTAIQTEYDTCKKIIDKNIETSFKSFG